jgi:hypothetical protein
MRHSLGKSNPAMDASISGPDFVLTLPDGQSLGDISVTRYPVLVTETEAEMVPRVKQGAELLRAFAMATGRRCGEITKCSTFVGDDGQRIPLA